MFYVLTDGKSLTGLYFINMYVCKKCEFENYINSIFLFLKLILTRTIFSNMESISFLKIMINVESKCQVKIVKITKYIIGKYVTH